MTTLELTLTIFGLILLNAIMLKLIWRKGCKNAQLIKHIIPKSVRPDDVIEAYTDHYLSKMIRSTTSYRVRIEIEEVKNES